MVLPPDTSAITHGIQLAWRPCSEKIAVSGMIGVVVGRLACIIDRPCGGRPRASTLNPNLARAYKEVGGTSGFARTAGQRLHCSADVLPSLIGTTIILLFLGETTDFSPAASRVAGFWRALPVLPSRWWASDRHCWPHACSTFTCCSKKWRGSSQESFGRQVPIWVVGVFHRSQAEMCPARLPAGGAVRVQAEQTAAHGRRHRARIARDQRAWRRRSRSKACWWTRLRWSSWAAARYRSVAAVARVKDGVIEVQGDHVERVMGCAAESWAQGQKRGSG